MNANVGRNWQDIHNSTNFVSETHSYGAQVSQPIFRGFRTLAETEAAEKQVLAERAKLQQVEQQLFTDIATAFFDLIRDQAILQYQRDNESILAKKLTEITARYKRGDLTQTDIRQAETRLAKASVSRLQAENNITADRASYQRLVGHLPDALNAEKFNLETPKTLEAVLAATPHHPDVISAQYIVEAAKAGVTYNEGSLLPELNLVGTNNRAWGENIAIAGQEKTNQIMLQATIPLYRSGADYSRIRAAEETVEQKKDDLEEARHKATENARNAWQALTTAKASYSADKDGVEAADKALEGVKVEANSGTRTTLDVLNAQQELLDAQIDLAKSIHDQQLSQVQIKAAIGELNADHIKLPVEQYDPEKNYDHVKYKPIGF